MTGRAALLLVFASAAPLTAQSFDVVSITLHPPEQGIAALNSNQTQRPGGSITMTNMPAALSTSRAYGIAPVNMAGLPGWAMSERYDLNAAASLTGVATGDQRAAMMKAMLAERFELAVHVEQRGQSNFDLVLARKDATLGPGITRSDTDCEKVIAERTAAQAATPQAGSPPRFDFEAPPSCSFRVVVDKTGLAGSYRVRMNSDQTSARRGPDVQVPDNAGPSVLVALPEQLGLKLESSKTMVDTLVIERLERPTEN